MAAKSSWHRHDGEFMKIWETASPHTMTSIERGYALYEAVKYICKRGLPGNIIESGVWRGGSSMIIALTLKKLGDTKRHLYLFDTFDGMPPPDDIDVDHQGTPAAQLLDEQKDERSESLIWAKSDRATVHHNMASTGYPMDRIHLIEGDVREKAKSVATGALALLRLDTDWYSSTKAELTEFWPRLTQHGALLIDDYGHWQGAKKAVDEYFDGSARPAVCLQAIDYTGRLVVRTTVNEVVAPAARYDFVPPEFEAPDLRDRFPQLEPTDPRSSREPKLRKTVPHIWRTDTRESSRSTGVVSAEEATLLYALAKTRSGRRAIEIGSHFGWSTAHLAAAGLKVDAVDPAFGDRERLEQVSGNLAEWVADSSIKLWPGSSPEILPAIAATADEAFGFAFVDGLHTDGGPIRDVQGLLPYLSDDALIVFHDLTFPDVANAVRFLKGKGWKLELYNTMQVMAAMYRDGVAPPAYAGDPNNPIALPPSMTELLAD